MTEVTVIRQDRLHIPREVHGRFPAPCRRAAPQRPQDHTHTPAHTLSHWPAQDTLLATHPEVLRQPFDLTRFRNAMTHLLKFSNNSSRNTAITRWKNATVSRCRTPGPAVHTYQTISHRRCAWEAGVVLQQSCVYLPSSER